MPAASERPRFGPVERRDLVIRTAEIEQLTFNEDAEAALSRTLSNLAAAHPVARLRAVHEIGELLRDELCEWVDRAELEQVRAARRRQPRASWDEIGRALGVSHTQAIRRFGNRV